MASITIRHTHEDGTLIEGSSKGDGVYDILRGLRGNWRYMPSIRRIGIAQSRDRNADPYKIKRAAEALRNAGHEVSVEVDESQRRSVAEIEADRAQRAEDRAERYEERAGKRSEQASADYARARQMAEAIPFGQPMMPDHHSYRRDVNYRHRMGRTFERAFQGMDEAKELQHRAEAAEASQSHRESVPATLRRIAKLEAERRSWQRAIDGEPGPHTRHDRETWACLPAEGRHLEQVKAQIEQLDEQLDYWRQHIAAAEAAGAKVWTRADFARGDYVLSRGTWYEVLRVNAKSLTVPWTVNWQVPAVTKANAVTAIGPSTSTSTLPYDDIRGRKSAEEMAAMLATAEA